METGDPGRSICLLRLVRSLLSEYLEGSEICLRVSQFYGERIVVDRYIGAYGIDSPYISEDLEPGCGV